MNLKSKPIGSLDSAYVQVCVARVLILVLIINKNKRKSVKFGDVRFCLVIVRCVLPRVSLIPRRTKLGESSVTLGTALNVILSTMS